MKYYVKNNENGWLDDNGNLYEVTEKQALHLRDNFGLMIRSFKEAYPCNSCELMERLYCVFGGSLNDEGICSNYKKLKGVTNE